ncbi:iron-containing alcohol dehydrogenase [bacterium]|nr:iron-containing alcohol dehydrogenase [bacterium]
MHAVPMPLDRYDLLVPSRIVFGAGRACEAGGLAAELGRVAWIVSGGRSGAASGGLDAVEVACRTAGMPTRRVACGAGEPTVDDVATALAALPRADRAAAVIIAVGGGATIDLAKAVAALATNAPADATDLDAAVVDHLEGVGRRPSISRPPLPLIAVPTTAGTGAEATRNAVISCPRRRFKKSMRSPLMVPRAAVVDPMLTLSCPRDTTVASGLDCITQLVEAFICRFRQPLPRALVLDALPRAVAALPAVLANPADLDARTALSHAALVSGIALTNSGLGMAHGVAAALGVECGTPHGLACAVMLPVALRVNEPVVQGDLALLERTIDGQAAGDDARAARAFVERIERLCREAGVPQRLREVGLAHDRLGWLAEHSGGASMRGNPVELDPAALLAILTACY